MKEKSVPYLKGLFTKNERKGPYLKGLFTKNERRGCSIPKGTVY